jgi:hypothetical protein
MRRRYLWGMSNLSPAAQMQMATLRHMSDKVQQIHGMVERFASTRDPRQVEMLGQPMKRAFGRLKLELMGAGLDTMSQLAGAMEIAAGRGGAPHSKGRILREGVGSLRFQIDQEQRKVAQEDQATQARAAEAKAAKAASASHPAGESSSS